MNTLPTTISRSNPNWNFPNGATTDRKKQFTDVEIGNQFS
jgi:hypothetical protein